MEIIVVLCVHRFSRISGLAVWLCFSVLPGGALQRYLQGTATRLCICMPEQLDKIGSPRSS